MKYQATKANQAQVTQHIQRQRDLGERMIGDNDRPTWLDLLVTLLIAATCIAVLGHLRGWW